MEDKGMTLLDLIVFVVICIAISKGVCKLFPSLIGHIFLVELIVAIALWLALMFIKKKLDKK